MDSAYVIALVEKIKACASDDESAHGLEDDLHQEVLQAIADGSNNAAELAKAALLTRDIDFARWCA
jgi:hypothetical protein